MVLLTLTPAARAAIGELYKVSRSKTNNEKEEDNELDERLEDLSKLEVGSAISHDDLIKVPKCLGERSRDVDGKIVIKKEWRLDALLRGAIVYQPPPPPKPEPTSEYKALMNRLRQEEEQRQYNLMLNPPPPLESFKQRYPNAPSTGTPQQTFSAGAGAPPDEDDEVTYADINRQMALIINVLVSIIACSVSIWIAARRWPVPQRLALSMTGSGLVAAAEVAIYFGYIRRVKDAKVRERGKVERKEVVETWVLSGKQSEKGKGQEVEGFRFRKGKHR